MAEGKLKIHTENLLPIIKRWLYSDKEIFLRELVSNACDALNKLRILSDHGEEKLLDQELRIDILIDKDKKTLKVIDTGIGMTKEEVETYIAQVAFSGAEEFLSKYKTENDKDQIIGHFGLGFFSAYMVSDLVTIDTLSYQKTAESVFWSCDGSTNYTIDVGTRSTRGTEITLFIGKESEEFLEKSRLQEILNRYCSFLPFPIFLNGERINDKEPLWNKQPSDCSDQDYIDFFHTLYPLQHDPLFWIHLNIDYPFHLKGILYFPKIEKRFDWSKGDLKLFCNRVFVSDNCKDLLPDFLTVLKGAIDSPDIPLNVSRSTLQLDRTVRQLSSHISKKIADRLQHLYTHQREKFYSVWPDIEVIVKLGALQDEKFYERVKDQIVWKNNQDDWTTVTDYLERHRETYKEKIFYTNEEKSPFLNLYKEKEIEVLYTTSPIDTPLLGFLEKHHSPVRFQRIDGAIDPSLLDPSREKTLLDAQGKSEAALIADFFRQALAAQNSSVEVEAKSLSSETLPAFILIEEQMRRLKETMALSGQPFPPSFGEKRTFVVNTSSRLVTSLYRLQTKHPELAKEMAMQLFELSLLSQKELEPGQLSPFITRTSQILEQLAEKLSI